MPELPEVETVRVGIVLYIEGCTITTVVVRNRRLRWLIPENLSGILANQRIDRITRRAKYLLFNCPAGTLLIHLGMSGILRLLTDNSDVGKHDHVDINFDNGYLLRFTDPRRFGSILWTNDNINNHFLLRHLGPEPLSTSFSTDYLMQKAQGWKRSIKSFIMDCKVVAGVGNIYANESLFLAGIHPKTVTGTILRGKLNKLVDVIKLVLRNAISKGGTTLKDFRTSNGSLGYFSQYLNVYGRNGDACRHCGSSVKVFKEVQRATYYCPLCQK